MAGSGGMQPFDIHPANPGELSQQSAQLATQASEAIDESRLSLMAFMPAVSNWDGIAAPELRAAPKPIRQRAYAVSNALSWASTALDYWAAQITAFNGEVQQILLNLASANTRILSATLPNGKPVPLSTSLEAMQAVEAEAKKLWHKAYDQYIVGGGRTAAGMLDAGPTPANVAAAASVGLVPPGQPWNPLSQMWKAFKGNAIPPGGLGNWPWALGRGAAAVGFGASALQYRYGYPWAEGGAARRVFGSGPRIGPRAWDLIGRAAKGAKIGGTAAGFLGSLNKRLHEGESPGGAAAGAAAETTTITGCAVTGGRLGAMEPIPHPLAKAGGALAGGIVGGVACSPVGDAVGDVTSKGVDALKDEGESILDGFKHLGTPRF